MGAPGGLHMDVVFFVLLHLILLYANDTTEPQTLFGFCFFVFSRCKVESQESIKEMYTQ